MKIPKSVKGGKLGKATSFQTQLAQFKEKTEKKYLQVKRAVVIELFSSVIMDTPVQTGRARGNWQISENTPAEGVVERMGHQVAIQEVVKHARNGVRVDSKTWLSNNLPYIVSLEMGASKDQAPAGMVRKNMTRVNRIIQENLRKFK